MKYIEFITRLRGARVPKEPTVADGIRDTVWLLFLPFSLLFRLVDVAASVAFLVIVGAVGLWLTGYIPDSTVAAVAADLADRAFAIAKAAGLFG